MRQAHQGEAVGGGWWGLFDMLRGARLTETLTFIIHSKIKGDILSERRDHTNYQLFIVRHLCCVYRSLITFGGRPRRYVSSEWRSSFEAFHFYRCAILATASSPRRHAAFAFKIKKKQALHHSLSNFSKLRKLHVNWSRK